VSKEFKIEHKDGGVAIGTRIFAKNGAYWSVAFFEPGKKAVKISMTDRELETYLRRLDADDRYIQRIIG